MIYNDVLRSLRHSLNVNDVKLAEIMALGELNIPVSDVSNMLKQETEDGYLPCDDLVMAHFLNGMVIFKRGQDATKPKQTIETPLTNNMILKKVRIAFELQDTDLTTLIVKAGIPITKSELSAFFRKPGHKNYRECGDQFLRNLLKGLCL